LIFTYKLIKDWPEEANFWGYGLDFGFFPDPAGLLKVGLFDGKLIFDEQFYEHKLNNIKIKEKPDHPSIQLRFEEIGIRKRDLIVADSAAKTSINELSTVGYNVEGVKKYPGSVLDGIKLMQQYQPFFVTERSINLKKEFDNYTWIKDPETGKFTKQPIDTFNHLIDPARYVTQTKKGGKETNKIKSYGFTN